MINKAMQRPFIAAYIFCLHVVLVVLVLHFDVITILMDKAGIAEKRTNPHVTTMHMINEIKSATVPSGAAVFLGDSITERLAVSAVATPSVNFGVSWQTSSEMLQSWPESVDRAGEVYVHIGANDILRGEQGRLAANIIEIDARLHEKRTTWTGIMLPNAASINDEIKRICAERDNCRYIPPITDPSMFIDGVHPNAKGYVAWIEEMRLQAIP